MYYYEIQLGWFPGCGWMRSPYGRPTYERALEEALQYMANAHLNGIQCAVRIHKAKEVGA